MTSIKARIISLLRESIRISRRYGRFVMDRSRNGFKHILPEKTFLLASTHRSGSTWLVNLIDHKKEFRILFEPFFPQKVPLISHLLPRQYLPASETSERYTLPVSDLLSGNFRNRWTTWHSSHLESKLMLIKTIRANLMLHWINRCFPEIKIILLIRHPCAVAHSVSSLGWYCSMELFTRQENLMRDLLSDKEQWLKEPRSYFECLILQWCIENFVPLTQLSKGNVHIVFYEELFSEPEKTLSSLFQYMELDPDESI